MNLEHLADPGEQEFGSDEPAAAILAREEAARTLPAAAAPADDLPDDVPTPAGATPRKEPIWGLRFFVMSIGQADCMLVVGPGPDFRTLMVDCGEAGDGKNFERVAENVRAIYKKLKKDIKNPRLDYFLATHPHADHVGFSPENGIFGLVEKEGFRIGTWIGAVDTNWKEYGPKSSGTRDLQKEMVSAWLNDGRIEQYPAVAFGPEMIDLGNGPVIDVVAFAGRASKDDQGIFQEITKREKDPKYFSTRPASPNDFSIATVISLGNFEMFTAGDLGGHPNTEGIEKTEKLPLTYPREFKDEKTGKIKKETYCNMEAWLLLEWQRTSRSGDVEVYRANHHGSGYSSSPQLINTLDPEFVIYSCGGGYDHPTRKVAERVKETAKQIATTSIATREWPKNQPRFQDLRGRILPKNQAYMEISVTADGRWYWIDGEWHEAFSDADEVDTKNVPGKDVGEEDRQHSS